MVEGAERFGLAQLHQLRGRVGRGKKQSYCLLFTSLNEPKQNRRLKAIESTFSGFTLAEVDLKIRGPGEIYGVRQSGFQELKIATLENESQLINARHEAEKVLPQLSRFPPLQEKLKNLTITDVKPN